MGRKYVFVYCHSVFDTKSRDTELYNIIHLYFTPLPNPLPNPLPQGARGFLLSKTNLPYSCHLERSETKSKDLCITIFNNNTVIAKQLVAVAI